MNIKLLAIFTIFSSNLFASNIVDMPSKQNFSLTTYSPSARNHGNETFPRIGRYLYRGMEPKLFSLNKALRAMFGDDSAVIESMMFSSIKLDLMDKIDLPVNSFIKRATKRDWWRRDLNGKKLYKVIDNIKSKNGGSLSEADAIEVAKRLINQSFTYQKQLDQSNSSFRTITDRIINYSSVNYSDFPRDVVFSSTYQKTASIYGSGIVVVKEKNSKSRSLDLTFWNFVNSAVWKGGADRGEFISPGFIDANEITGYEVHRRGNYPDRTTQYVGIGVYAVQKHQPIEVAFYKYKLNGETYVIALDGEDKRSRKRHCLRENREKFYFCRRGDDINSFDLPPRLTRSEANLMGVVKLCPKTGTCSRPDEVFKKFSFKSKRALPVLNMDGIGHGDLAKSIRDVSIGDKKAIYFPSI